MILASCSCLFSKFWGYPFISHSLQVRRQTFCHWLPSPCEYAIAFAPRPGTAVPGTPCERHRFLLSFASETAKFRHFAQNVAHILQNVSHFVMRSLCFHTHRRIDLHFLIFPALTGLRSAKLSEGKVKAGAGLAQRCIPVEYHQVYYLSRDKTSDSEPERNGRPQRTFFASLFSPACAVPKGRRYIVLPITGRYSGCAICRGRRLAARWVLLFVVKLRKRVASACALIAARPWHDSCQVIAGWSVYAVTGLVH
jgi:hypothetical protein